MCQVFRVGASASLSGLKVDSWMSGWMGKNALMCEWNVKQNPSWHLNRREGFAGCLGNCLPARWMWASGRGVNRGLWAGESGGRRLAHRRTPHGGSLPMIRQRRGPACTCRSSRRPKPGGLRRRDALFSEKGVRMGFNVAPVPHPAGFCQELLCSQSRAGCFMERSVEWIIRHNLCFTFPSRRNRMWERHGRHCCSRWQKRKWGLVSDFQHESHRLFQSLMFK